MEIKYKNVREIKGIGPKKAEALRNLNIETMEDVLHSYPRAYEDRSRVQGIGSLTTGENAFIRGQVLIIKKDFSSRRKKGTLRLLVEDKTGRLEIVFFQAGFLEKSLVVQQYYTFYGKVTENTGRLQMLHPSFELSGEENGTLATGILPVYPLVRGLTQKEMRRLVQLAFQGVDSKDEYLSEDIRQKRNLCDFSYAIHNIHFPENLRKYKEAKYRLIYDELFLLQMGLFLNSSKKCSNEKGIVFSKAVDMNDFTKTLPYPLTEAQKRVLQEVSRDMELDTPMSRLIQGDVGSGKTAVAAAALYKAAKSGYQGVLMAPTELLAKQHYETFTQMFRQFSIKIGFLASALGKKEKERVLDQLASGEIQILIGTHALIQPNVAFQNLGLVITDEQHRFGVNQRLTLAQKGQSPDILIMTATPIPRTLAVVIYGDLDISVIDQLPPGRKPIITKVASRKNRKQMFRFVENELEKGRQIYIVTPLIEDSQQMDDVLSAETVYNEMKSLFPQYQSALLHGEMKQMEKDHTMEQFSKGQVQILVATVVIEVGIHVSNATIMVVENAERFGLAQLHQLRGRVGRGEHQSYCILISNAKTEVGKQRAQIMAETNDGFVIAEKDLQLRGPGEFFGTKQHGIPELKLADLIQHMGILNDVRKDVFEILQDDPELQQERHREIRRRVARMFGSIDQFPI